MIRITSLLVLVLLAYTGHAQFSYRRPLQEVSSEGWYRIPLTNDLLGKLNSSFTDIRLYHLEGADTAEVPYLLRVSNDVIRTQPAELTPFNISYKGTQLFFTIKLQSGQLVNSAVFNFKQPNYDARITVEGSNDQKEWFTVAEDARLLSLQEGAIRYQYNTVYFPSSGYSYIRFTVKNDSLLTLGSVLFSNKLLQPGTYSTIPASFTRKETTAKETELIVSFPGKALLSKLIIEAEPGQRFYRSLQIEEITDSVKTDKGWQYQYNHLHTGTFTSFRQDTLILDPRMVSKLRITIANQDNEPVMIKSVTGHSPEVILVASLKPGKHHVLYSNKDIGPPQYDLAHFEKEIPTNLPSLTMEEEIADSPTIEDGSKAWFENKFWLWGILLVIILLIGVATIRMMGNRQEGK